MTEHPMNPDGSRKYTVGEAVPQSERRYGKRRVRPYSRMTITKFENGYIWLKHYTRKYYRKRVKYTPEIHSYFFPTIPYGAINV